MVKSSPPVPDDLTREAKNRLYHWHREKWPHHFKDRSSRATFVANSIEECLDHHRAPGNPKGIKDFEAACRTWMRNGMKYMGYEPYTPPSSVPNPRGNKPFESKNAGLQSIKGQLRLVK
jgi:hypothetical protein